MKPPPRELDGAQLICFAEVAGAVVPTGKTTHRSGGGVLPPAQGLAVCQYPGEPSFYLFYCDQDWTVLTDTFHLSLDEARKQAEFEYTGISSQWKLAP